WVAWAAWACNARRAGLVPALRRPPHDSKNPAGCKTCGVFFGSLGTVRKRRVRHCQTPPARCSSLCGSAAHSARTEQTDAQQREGQWLGHVVRDLPDQFSFNRSRKVGEVGHVNDKASAPLDSAVVVVGDGHRADGQTVDGVDTLAQCVIATVCNGAVAVVACPVTRHVHDLTYGLEPVTGTTRFRTEQARPIAYGA